MTKIENARLLLLSTVLCACVGVALLLPATTISVDLRSFLQVFLLVALLFAASFYCRFRRMGNVSAIFELMACGILLSIPALIASYMAASLRFPLADMRLEEMDAALGFDGISFIRAIDSSAILSHGLFFAYVSFSYQLMALPCLLVLSGRRERGYLMVAGYGIICMISAVISIWYPAISAYPAYQLDPLSVHHINTHFAYAFLEQYDAVRKGAGFVLSMQGAEGILTFPSVHAAIACLCAWAAWSTVLRYPFLLLNVAMAVSAVSHGSHYLVDIIAGIGVAGFSIAAINYIVGTAASSPIRLRSPFARS